MLGVQPQPQGRVCGDDGVRGALGVGEAGALGRDQGPGLGEPGEGASEFAPAQDDRGRGQRAVLAGCGCAGRRGVRGARRQVIGERARGPEQEHVPGGDREAQGSGPVDDGDGEDAVAAGPEEVAVAVDGGAGQGFGEDADQCGERGAGRGAGRGGRYVLRCVVRCAVRRGACGQGLAVQFAVDRQRQGVDRQDQAGHHVDGQLRGQQAGEGCGVEGDPAHDVRDQVVRAVGHGDGHVDHTVEFPDRGLHLTEFDAEALELHLVVGAAGELQLAVERPAGEVARVVHPGTVAGERVRDEPARGEGRAAQVAEGDLVAGDVDGAHPARRDRSEPVVEQVGDQSGDRAADRADVAAGAEVLVGQDPVRDVHGGLGDAVHVDQLGRGRPVPLDPAAQPPGIQCLAPEDDPAQGGGGLVGVPVGLDELVEGRRGLVEDGHPALAHQAVEVDG